MTLTPISDVVVAGPDSVRVSERETADSLREYIPPSNGRWMVTCPGLALDPRFFYMPLYWPGHEAEPRESMAVRSVHVSVTDGVVSGSFVRHARPTLSLRPGMVNA